MSTPAKKSAPASAPSIVELSSRWARAKVMEETGRREAAAVREELVAAGVVVGYQDEHLVVGETSKLDVEDERLLNVLREEELLKDVTVPTVKADLIHAAAKFNERVARAADRATVKSPRFEQAAKKSK